MQRFIEKEPSAISAASLSEMTGERLREMLAWERELPQQEERARLLREVKHFADRNDAAHKHKHKHKQTPKHSKHTDIGDPHDSFWLFTGGLLLGG